MKYAQKFMVVPFKEDVLESPEQKYLTNLDNYMQKIINNKKLSPDEKVKLYTDSLIRFVGQVDNVRDNSPTKIIVNTIKDISKKDEPDPIPKIAKKTQKTRSLSPVNRALFVGESESEDGVLTDDNDEYKSPSPIFSPKEKTDDSFVNELDKNISEDESETDEVNLQKGEVLIKKPEVKAKYHDALLKTNSKFEDFFKNQKFTRGSVKFAKYQQNQNALALDHFDKYFNPKNQQNEQEIVDKYFKCAEFLKFIHNNRFSQGQLSNAFKKAQLIISNVQLSPNNKTKQIDAQKITIMEYINFRKSFVGQKGEGTLSKKNTSTLYQTGRGFTFVSCP